MSADWMTPENLADAKLAWEETDVTAADIGIEYGVSKSAVIGAARRLGWSSRADGPVVLTLFDRMDSLHANMDQVLNDTKGVGVVAQVPQPRLLKSDARLKMQLSQQARRARERIL